MEKILDIKVPVNKIYKDRAIWVATFLGGPLAAGYIIAENFKTFNEPEKAKKTWIFSIIATIIVFGGVFLIPENVKIPGQLIPLIYTGIAFYLVQHFQGKQILEHLNFGGHFFGWGRIILVGLIGLAITLLPILGFSLMSNPSPIAGAETKYYGNAKNEIAFYKENISEIEVNAIAEGLKKTTFFDDVVAKFVFASKEEGNYVISISVLDGIQGDNQNYLPFTLLKNDLQIIFPENKIILKLFVDDLNNVVKTIE